MSASNARLRPSQTDIWLTPRWLIEAIGPFDFDPCGAPEGSSHDCARRVNRLPSCGLSAEWGGRVWLNPPYSNVAPFIAKLAEHGRGTALLYARTDTRWFHESIARRASLIALFVGRVQFVRRDGTEGTASPAPSMLIAYGEEDARRIREAIRDGKIKASIFTAETSAA